MGDPGTAGGERGTQCPCHGEESMREHGTWYGGEEGMAGHTETLTLGALRDPGGICYRREREDSSDDKFNVGLVHYFCERNKTGG